MEEETYVEKQARKGDKCQSKSVCVKEKERREGDKGRIDDTFSSRSQQKTD